MKHIIIVLIILSGFIYFSCEKEPENDERANYTELLTSHTWLSDSLLADGIEASDSGEILEKFAGETKFNTDGTGTIGQYEGEWRFNEEKTQIIITADSLQSAVTTIIREITETSLKVTTAFPKTDGTSGFLMIRMTFIPKKD